jgi:hypothetical protein
MSDDIKNKCLEELPYEMGQLEVLLDIEPEDLDIIEHVNEVINTVESPPNPVARRELN